MPPPPTAAREREPAREPASPPEPATRDAPPRCPNCGADASGRYCANCGQEQGPLVHSVRAIGREFVEEYFSYDAKVWRTLTALVARPGLLTRSYVAGQRATYLRPLRLYLTASVIFFLAFAFEVSRGWSPVKVNTTPVSRPVRAAAPARSTSAEPASDAASRAEAELERAMQRRWRRVNALAPGQRERLFADGVGRFLPNAMFALMPLFALLLRVFYLRSGRLYAEHFIFALHVHAFAFVVGTVGVLLPATPGDILPKVALAWLAVYTVLAMRRVYGESYARTVGKFVALFGLYALALGATMLALLLASLFSA